MLSLPTHWPWNWRRRAMTDAGIGWLALSTCVLAAATYNPFAKALSPALSPLSLVLVSELLVLLFVLVTFGGLPIVRTCARLPHKDVLWLLIAGTFNGFLAPMLWFTGLSLTTAVNAGLFGRVEIVFLLASAALLLGERITRTHILAMCTILAGIAVISLRGFTDGLSMRPGDAIIMAAALSFAIGSVLSRKFLRHVQPHILLGARSSAALAGIVFVSPFVEHSFAADISLIPATLLPALIGFGFVSRFINSVAFYEALKRLPISTISLSMSIDVVLGSVVAWAMLGESIHWYHFLGGGFIVLGILLLELLGTHPTEEALEHHVRQRHR